MCIRDSSNIEELQAENLRKMLLAMSRDVRVMIIKLCDRLHNMRTGDAWPEQKRRDKARETMEVYAPIANRLGILNVKEELEDRSLHSVSYTHLDVYKRQVEACTAEVTHNGELTSPVTLDTDLRFYTRSGSEVKFEYTTLEADSVEVTLQVYKLATLPDVYKRQLRH